MNFLFEFYNQSSPLALKLPRITAQPPQLRHQNTADLHPTTEQKGIDSEQHSNDIVLSKKGNFEVNFATDQTECNLEEISSTRVVSPTEANETKTDVKCQGNIIAVSSSGKAWASRLTPYKVKLRKMKGLNCQRSLVYA